MEVSVIVPIYNADKTLLRTLEALQNQTMNSFEVIMVDNGSTDCSESICKMIAKKDDRFRYVRTEIKGVSNARNVGMKNATGRFLCFCDADDIPDKSMLNVLYEDIEPNKADYVIANYYSERDERRSCFPETWSRNLDKEDVCSKLIPAMFINECGKDTLWGTVWRGIFRRELIEQNDLMFDVEVTFAEDLLFVLEYLAIAKTIILEDKVLYWYSMTEGSAMLSYSRYKPELFSERIHLINSLKIPLEKTGVYSTHRSAINTIFQEYILECIGNASLIAESEGWLSAYSQIKEITNSDLVREIFEKITTSDRKHKIIFSLIKLQLNVPLAIYYSIRRKARRG